MRAQKKPKSVAAAPTPKNSRTPASRWTEALVKGGWTPVSDEFLRLYGQLYPPISNGEAMFILQLLSFKWDEKMPRPGFKTVAKRMGVSDTQARSYARNLEKNSYLARVSRVGKTNRYDLSKLFAALEKEMRARLEKRAAEEEEED